jgi:diacylglycerol O-acyltransferase
MQAASSLEPFNLIVTNVRGPSIPLYLLGSRLSEIVPFVPLMPNQRVGIAIASYCDQVCLGLSGDWEAVPNLEELRTDLEGAHGDLQAAIGSPCSKTVPFTHKGISAEQSARP